MHPHPGIDHHPARLGAPTPTGFFFAATDADRSPPRTRVAYPPHARPAIPPPLTCATLRRLRQGDFPRPGLAPHRPRRSPHQQPRSARGNRLDSTGSARGFPFVGGMALIVLLDRATLNAGSSHVESDAEAPRVARAAAKPHRWWPMMSYARRTVPRRNMSTTVSSTARPDPSSFAHRSR